MGEERKEGLVKCPCFGEGNELLNAVSITLPSKYTLRILKRTFLLGDNNISMRNVF